MNKKKILNTLSKLSYLLGFVLLFISLLEVLSITNFFNDILGFFLSAIVFALSEYVFHNTSKSMEA